MELALLIIVSLFASIIVLQFGRIHDLEDSLEKEIKHSLALENTINDYVKKN